MGVKPSNRMVSPLLTIIIGWREIPGHSVGHRK